MPTTPVLMIDQYGNKSTKMLTEQEVADLAHCLDAPCGNFTSLPPDEGLDESICYRVFVQVTGV